MKNLIKTAALGGAVLALSTFTVMADPIEGMWKTQSGESAKISNCGGSYCIVLKTGKHAGKHIGKLAGSNGNYDGTVTDPKDDKTYTGNAKVTGGKMKLKGCVMKIFCKTQHWNKI